MARRNNHNLKLFWEAKQRLKTIRVQDPIDNPKFTEQIDAGIKRVSEEIDEELDRMYGQSTSKPAKFQARIPSKPE